MLKKIPLIIAFILIFPVFCLGGENMRLQIKVGDLAVEGTLEDNAITQQLTALSPVSMEMKDYAGQERIGYPPEKLGTKGNKFGLFPKEGDIALFAPWGNLCVFIKDASYSGDLIYLGKINSGLNILKTQKEPFSSQWIISR